MKALQSPLFVGCSLLFLLHQLLQYGLGVHLRVLDAWADNLVAMPIILTLLVWERQTLFGGGPSYRLCGAEVAIATLCVSVISEFVFPLWSPRFTFDWLDFVFYAAGAGLYWVQARRPAAG